MYPALFGFSATNLCIFLCKYGFFRFIFELFCVRFDTLKSDANRWYIRKNTLLQRIACFSCFGGVGGICLHFLPMAKNKCGAARGRRHLTVHRTVRFRVQIPLPLQSRKEPTAKCGQLFSGGVGEIRTLARVLDAYSLSRGAPSASWVPLRMSRKYKGKNGGESGIRTHGPLPGHWFSRPAP